MADLRNKTAYQKKFKAHLKTMSAEDAVKVHIGGIPDYERYGYIGAELIKKYLVPDDGFLIDVGCGSGRMAGYLSGLPNLKYLGTDVVKKILKFAAKRANRPDWRFLEVDDFAIPAHNSSADGVCFFSVLTHLLHEQSFLYLKEANRVLKPGGRVGFTFLEFANPGHRALFRIMAQNWHEREELSIFFDKPAIEFWASELNMRIVQYLDGHKPVITLESDVTLLDGTTISGGQILGQSFCVLEKAK